MEACCVPSEVRTESVRLMYINVNCRKVNGSITFRKIIVAITNMYKLRNNNVVKVCININMRRVRESIVAVEKQ